MIEYIHQRLWDWAEEVLHGYQGGGMAASPLSTAMACGAVMPRGTAQIGVSISKQAQDVERLVNRLAGVQRQVVMETYLQSNTVAQKLKALRLSRRTYYRLLDDVHLFIQGGL